MKIIRGLFLLLLVYSNSYLVHKISEVLYYTKDIEIVQKNYTKDREVL